MDARLYRFVLGIAVLGSTGAGYAPNSAVVASGGACQSPHFIVSAPTQGLAREICVAAERYRHELALEWLSHELPEWQAKCTIQVQVGPNLGAGGATSFAFVNKQPVDFRMTIQGSHARLLDSVLPHEITHTIFATHFGRPLPRWADEGAATSVEDISERSKQDRLLVQFLTTDRGIAFNRMFAMREYPDDILPLYSQGYSLARYLIAQGDRKKFVSYVGDGMRMNNWTAATQMHYGFGSLSDLQITWLDWVRQGSPMNIQPRTAPIANIATISAPGHFVSTTSPTQDATMPRGETAASFDGLVPLPTELLQSALPTSGKTMARTAGSSAGSWYARQRDAKTPTSQPLVEWARETQLRSQRSRSETNHQAARPQPVGHPGQVILEWSRNNQSGSGILR